MEITGFADANHRIVAVVTPTATQINQTAGTALLSFARFTTPSTNAVATAVNG